MRGIIDNQPGWKMTDDDIKITVTVLSTGVEQVLCTAGSGLEVYSTLTNSGHSEHGDQSAG